MDEEAHELAARLCTRIGMIMEDTSVLALTAGSLAFMEQRVVLEKLRSAALQIEALSKAAVLLVEASR